MKQRETAAYLPYKDSQDEDRKLEDLRQLEVEVEADINSPRISDDERRERIGRGIYLLDEASRGLFYGETVTIAGLYSETVCTVNERVVEFSDVLRHGIVRGTSAGYSVVPEELFRPDAENDSESSLYTAASLITARYSGKLLVCHAVTVDVAQLNDTLFRWHGDIITRILAPIGASSMYSVESRLQRYKAILDAYREWYDLAPVSIQEAMEDATLSLINSEDILHGLVEAAANIRTALTHAANDKAQDGRGKDVVIHYLNAIIDGGLDGAAYSTNDLPPLIAVKDGRTYICELEENESVAFKIVDFVALPHINIDPSNMLVFEPDVPALYVHISILNQSSDYQGVRLLLPIEHAKCDVLKRLY